MINVKKFIYDELINEATLSWYVGNRIYPRVATLWTDYPLVVFNRVDASKIDVKWIRNEYYQISVWWKKELENEDIMHVITSHFNWLKKQPVKYVNIERIDETFDDSTKAYWIHITIHIKMIENLL